MTARKVRPTTWDSFIGQKDTVKRLRVMVDAAKKEGRPLDHILLTGPPGLGKTTLGGIIAGALGSNLYVTTAPAIPTPPDLAAFLIVGKPLDVFIIDEIHRITRQVEETLYPAMEDGVIDTTLDLLGEKWTGRVALNPFTLIGATTIAGSLGQPMRDRFGTVERLEPYGLEDITSIVERTAGLLGVVLMKEAKEEIARRSRGTPRVANRLLARVRDYALSHGVEVIGLGLAIEALELFGADSHGLDYVGRSIVEALARADRPLGVETLAALVHEDKATVEALEGHLLRVGLVERTPRGRQITSAGKKYAASMKEVS